VVKLTLKVMGYPSKSNFVSLINGDCSSVASRTLSYRRLSSCMIFWRLKSSAFTRLCSSSTFSFSNLSSISNHSYLHTSFPSLPSKSFWESPITKSSISTMTSYIAVASRMTFNMKALKSFETKWAHSLLGKSDYGNILGNIFQGRNVPCQRTHDLVSWKCFVECVIEASEGQAVHAWTLSEMQRVKPKGNHVPLILFTRINELCTRNHLFLLCLSWLTLY
jgi:hypothetical protein